MPDLCALAAEWGRGRTCFMGVGSVDAGDDAFGVRLAESLAGRVPPPGRGGPAIVSAGTEPERHVRRLLGAELDHLVFLDAVSFGGAPGSLLLADAGAMAAQLPQISTHRISLSLLARCVEERGRTKAWLVGVEPLSLRRGQALSRPVQASLSALADVLAGPWRPAAAPRGAALPPRDGSQERG